MNISERNENALESIKLLREDLIKRNIIINNSRAENALKYCEELLVDFEIYEESIEMVVTEIFGGEYLGVVIGKFKNLWIGFNKQSRLTFFATVKPVKKTKPVTFDEWKDSSKEHIENILRKEYDNYYKEQMGG